MKLLNSLPPGLKKLLSIAFLAGLVILGGRVCTVETTHCELIFDLGPASQQKAGEELQELEVQLFDAEGGEPVGSFRKLYSAEQGPPARWPLSVSSGSYRVEGELRSNLRVRHFSHEVDLDNDRTIRLHLDRYLVE